MLGHVVKELTTKADWLRLQPGDLFAWSSGLTNSPPDSKKLHWKLLKIDGEIVHYEVCGRESYCVGAEHRTIVGDLINAQLVLVRFETPSIPGVPSY